MKDIKAYLDQDEQKSLLRLLTAGSVDDGKSTLIGRLLFDSKKIYEDQLSALERDSRRVGNAGAGQIDYALLLDGLKAEREEGITIDVAYRYFSTNKRKFIIADTPGHEQYTRNMITGGSTANLAIILVDARSGIVTQTRRHTYLVSLLGIRHIVLAVNKMDLTGYSEEVFNDIRTDYQTLTGMLGVDDVTCIPLSALRGDNVVERSEHMPWYNGPALLEFLETVPIDLDRNMKDFRFPVQYVLRPNLNFRGFSGKIASGVVKRGDEIVALPSMKKSRIARIVTYDGDIEEAFCPQSVTLCLEDEIDISRGEMIVKAEAKQPVVSTAFRAMLVWMDEEPMDPGKQFFLKQTTRTVRAAITHTNHIVNVNTMAHEEARDFTLNTIGEVEVETAQPLFFDAYQENRATGSFILIDPISDNTSAVGMILSSLEGVGRTDFRRPLIDMEALDIGEEHREALEKALESLRKQNIDIELR